MKAAILTGFAALALGTAGLASAADPVRVPERGLDKTAVTRLLGEPDQRLAPVGDPPITRWRYPGMTVYFEYDLVLHTVLDAPDT